VHNRSKLNEEEEIQALRSPVNKLPERFSIRSNYAHTLNALKEALGQENCFISFCKTLLTKSTYSILCEFLYINFIAPNRENKVNVSATSTQIQEDIMQKLGIW